MQIILLGPPGAGKGTQGDLIQKKINIPKLSTGDMLREAVAKGTDVGRHADEAMKAGKLVSDGTMIRLIRECIATPQCAEGFILDGFPRTLAQAKALDELLARIGKPITFVIELTVDDASLIERIAGRFACAKCGAGYNDVSKPTNKPGKCDNCSSTEFIRRKDDTRETMTTRLNAYHTQTSPLLPYYQEKGLLRRVNGMEDIHRVTAEIDKIIATPSMGVSETS